MRILIYGLNFKPELSGVGKYTGELADGLRRRGFSVRVVTAPPYYPAWRIAEGYSPWAYTRENDGGTDVIRCPLWVPSKTSGLRRILHLMSFALSSLPVVLREAFCWRPHAVITVAPAFMCAPAGLIAARLSGAAAYLHVQDFEVQAAFNLGILKSPSLQALALRMEEVILRGFDRVTTISGRMRERLWQKGVDENHAATFLNSVDLNAIHPMADRRSWRRTQGIPDDALLVLYSGSMGEKQGLHLVVDAAKELSGRPIEFVLCGEGPAVASLRSRAAGLSKVRFLPLQPASELNAMLNAADLHVLPQLVGAEDLVMPSKLGPILASGGAVVATARKNTELASVIEAAGGFLCPPGDAHALAGLIDTLSNESSGIEQARVRSRTYAQEHLDGEKILSGFIRLLQRDISEADTNAQVQLRN